MTAARYRFRPVLEAGINQLFVANYNYSTGLDPVFNNHKNNTYAIKNAIGEEINIGADVFLSKTERSVILRTIVNISYSGNNKILAKASDSLLEKYNALSVGVNPQLLFNVYTNTDFKVYLIGGVEAFIAVGQKGSYVAPNYQFYFNTPVREQFDFTFTTKAEIDLKKSFGFYIGYDPPSAFGQKYNRLSAFHAGVNYFFGK